MTASNPSRMPLGAWTPLQDLANQFRDEYAAWEQASNELFCDLDRVREELAHKALELDDGRKRLAERGRQLAEQRKETSRLSQQLEQQETRLSQALSELRGLREQLAQEREDVRKREHERTSALQAQIIQLQGQIGKLQTERDELKQLLDLARSEGGGSGGASPAQLVEPLLRNLAELKHEMNSTRSSLAGAIEQALARSASRTGPAAAGGGDPARLHEVEKERVELESELELVRARAAELQETVQQQRRELTEQRAELTAELRELRKIIEQQAEMLGQSGHSHTSGGIHRIESHPEPKPSPTVTITLPARENVRESSVVAATADPVVNSVMAQFAKLQKDVALRRKKK